MKGLARARRASRAVGWVYVGVGVGVVVVASACSGGGRDVVTPSTDVVGGANASTATAGYDYVARRPHAVVGLAESRGVDPPIARAAVDRLADAAEQCVTDAQRRGAPVDGAGRVVAQVDASGAVANATIRVDPKAGAAASGVLCLLAPARLLVFPATSDRAERGFAVEGIWGSVVGH